MGIFQKIDLPQVLGFIQEIMAIRTQMAHVKLFPFLGVAITQTIDCLKCGVVNQARTKKADDAIFRIFFGSNNIWKRETEEKIEDLPNGMSLFPHKTLRRDRDKGGRIRDPVLEGKMRPPPSQVEEDPKTQKGSLQEENTSERGID